jgi:hypothetical protein
MKFMLFNFEFVLSWRTNQIKTMKPFPYSRFAVTILVALFTISLSNCSVHTRTTVVKTKRIPPGQAKKMTGAKSARRYAPGHNK